MSELNDLKQQIATAEIKLDELRKRLIDEEKNNRVHAIHEVRELIKSHGLIASEVGFSGKTFGKRLGVAINKRIEVQPKYRDPESGKTWTGRGRTPIWLVTQVSSGRNKEDFRI